MLLHICLKNLILAHCRQLPKRSRMSIRDVGAQNLYLNSLTKLGYPKMLVFS